MAFPCSNILELPEHQPCVMKGLSQNLLEAYYGNCFYTLSDQTRTIFTGWSSKFYHWSRQISCTNLIVGQVRVSGGTCFDMCELCRSKCMDSSFIEYVGNASLPSPFRCMKYNTSSPSPRTCFLFYSIQSPTTRIYVSMNYHLYGVCHNGFWFGRDLYYRLSDPFFPPRSLGKRTDNLFIFSI